MPQPNFLVSSAHRQFDPQFFQASMSVPSQAAKRCRDLRFASMRYPFLRLRRSSLRRIWVQPDNVDAAGPQSVRYTLEVMTCSVLREQMTKSADRAKRRINGFTDTKIRHIC